MVRAGLTGTPTLDTVPVSALWRHLSGLRLDFLSTEGGLYAAYSGAVGIHVRVVLLFKLTQDPLGNLWREGVTEVLKELLEIVTTYNQNTISDLVAELDSACHFFPFSRLIVLSIAPITSSNVRSGWSFQREMLAGHSSSIKQ